MFGEQHNKKALHMLSVVSKHALGRMKAELHKLAMLVITVLISSNRSEKDNDLWVKERNLLQILYMSGSCWSLLQVLVVRGIPRYLVGSVPVSPFAISCLIYDILFWPAANRDDFDIFICNHDIKPNWCITPRTKEPIKRSFTAISEYQYINSKNEMS